jgi:hypothetical protein
MKMTLFSEKPLRNNVSILLFLVSVLSRINLYEYQICSSLIQITFTSTVLPRISVHGGTKKLAAGGANS